MTNQKIRVRKASGDYEPFLEEKVRSSLQRAGVEKELIENIIAHIKEQLYDEIPTKELYRLIHEEIDRQGLHQHAQFYRLREALAKVDPSDFEKFIKKILEKEGYKCQWNVIVQGFCIDHQVDVIAKKDKQLFFVEVKHHRNPHRDCGLGTVTELWARLDDVKDGFENGKNNCDFSGAWLINNTKFSHHAKKYSKCKGIKLTGWRYQGAQGLEKLVKLEDIKEYLTEKDPLF